MCRGECQVRGVCLVSTKNVRRSSRGREVTVGHPSLVFHAGLWPSLSPFLRDIGRVQGFLSAQTVFLTVAMSTTRKALAREHLGFVVDLHGVGNNSPLGWGKLAPAYQVRQHANTCIWHQVCKVLSRNVDKVRLSFAWLVSWDLPPLPSPVLASK